MRRLRWPYPLPGEPRITTLLRFEYQNNLAVPVYIPLGSKNKLKGNAYYIGEPPVVFEPGVHTFDVYTDGGGLQWEVKTDACNSASKSANGSNANPCDNSPGRPAPGSGTFSAIGSTEWSVVLFPNPARSGAWLQASNAESPVKVEIYTGLGRLLSSNIYPELGSEKVYFDVSDYPSGLLLFRVSCGEESRVVKLMKE